MIETMAARYASVIGAPEGEGFALTIADNNGGATVEGTAAELHAFAGRVSGEVSALAGPADDGPLLRALRSLEALRDAAEQDGDGHIREGLDEAIDVVSDELDDALRCARCRRGITDPQNAPDDGSALCRYCGDVDETPED